MKTILLVDDEERMLDLLSLYLSPLGFHCIKCQCGEKAVDYIKQQSIDVVLLDVMMPIKDGWETCQEIRVFSEVPVIMLTARGDKEEVVKGLRLGADDYIVKPFDEEELVARIQAVVRRAASVETKQVIFSDLIWNEDSHELTSSGRKILLTPKEFSLLGLLLKNQNRVFSREQLLSVVWGYGSITDDRTIDSHIRNIREKLRSSGFPVDDYLQTVWGVGYKWV
ncbi:response regulator transcription factor [Jeotgalibacillus soli]|uniref:XRE family transcriptional regulator n=1 Tax=Jeotgalibacillus soli TaxID=889306 RepID=A0A0C2VKK7_9BACL|nr:response regulator transcription factor [Jeotgalibacillus soli]KIL49437.1 XRE family transcriptional regulator [Jeotgalibacillus soli]